MNEPFDPAEISEFEQRLMQSRPRSPKLDIDAILELTDDKAAAASIERKRSDRSRSFFTPQFVGSIAASWICGVIVGAAGIFWLPSGRELATQNRDTIVSNELGQPKAVRSNQTELKPNIETGDRSNEFWPIDLDVETLQAGMSLRSRGQLVGVKDRSSDSLAGRSTMKRARTNRLIEDDSDAVLGSLESRFAPSKPMTNAELFKELSGEDGWRIH